MWELPNPTLEGLPVLKPNHKNIDKKRILLIDDEEVILFGFKQVLAEPWLTVDTASSAIDANALLSVWTYAAVVVDLRLSNSMALEGLELIPIIKNLHKDCRIIVLTAYSDELIRRQALDAGADLFLEKPVDPEQIKENLREMGVY
jgi:DNA-binding NtrC family response regulator